MSRALPLSAPRQTVGGRAIRLNALKVAMVSSTEQGLTQAPESPGFVHKSLNRKAASTPAPPRMCHYRPSRQPPQRKIVKHYLLKGFLQGHASATESQSYKGSLGFHRTPAGRAFDVEDSRVSSVTEDKKLRRRRRVGPFPHAGRVIDPLSHSSASFGGDGMLFRDHPRRPVRYRTMIRVGLRRRTALRMLATSHAGEVRSKSGADPQR